MAGGSKPRVGVILRQTTGVQKSSHTIERVDGLKNEFKEMCQDLKRLQKALKQRHAAMEETLQAQDAMANSFALLSKDTPLSELVGCRSVKDDPTTYGRAVDLWTTKSRSRADEFSKFALDYVTKWEKTVTTRVNTEMKQTEQLRRNADHYETKVNSLVSSMEKLEQKKKPVPEATTEKWTRNKEKYQEATEDHQESARQLEILLDEIVHRSWRELHPLILQLVQFDLDIAQEDEVAVMKEMRRVGSGLVDLARAEEIKPRYKPTWTWSHVGASFFQEEQPSF